MSGRRYSNAIVMSLCYRLKLRYLIAVYWGFAAGSCKIPLLYSN